MSTSKKKDIVYSIVAITLGAFFILAFLWDYMGYGFVSFSPWEDGVMLILSIFFFIAGIYGLTHLSKS
jgi:hypothetical protein